jgi:hypothetical protein
MDEEQWNSVRARLAVMYEVKGYRVRKVRVRVRFYRDCGCEVLVPMTVNIYR